jgi:hypothetical protein
MSAENAATTTGMIGTTGRRPDGAREGGLRLQSNVVAEP